MTEAVNTTKTKTMGRWVEGEKEEKARGCAADKGALERRKHSELRRERVPISMSLLENSKKKGVAYQAQLHTPILHVCIDQAYNAGEFPLLFRLRSLCLDINGPRG